MPDFTAEGALIREPLEMIDPANHELPDLHPFDADAQTRRRQGEGLMQMPYRVSSARPSAFDAPSAGARRRYSHTRRRHVTAGRTRVLVADDHAMYRIAVQQAVNTAPDLEVAGVARDGAEAWNMALELNPDVLVLDGDMPIVSGIEVLARLRTEMPHVRIVLNTSDPALAAIGRGLGAECVAKEGLPEILLAAIRGSTATVAR